MRRVWIPLALCLIAKILATVQDEDFSKVQIKVSARSPVWIMCETMRRC
jgi:hypothetical protein